MTTSNRPLEDWGELIGDVPAATAILDSLPHHAEVILLTGRTCRPQGDGGNDGRKDCPRKNPASEDPDKQRSSCQKPQE